MTVPDLGAHRRSHASDTRQLIDRARTEPSAHVSARAFWTALAVILLAIAVFAVILWWT